MTEPRDADRHPGLPSSGDLPMHADEVAIDTPLVRRLLAAQFPGWADLPLERVASDGTDNAMYRLGDDLAVRLPRRPAAARQGDKERAWLPRVAPSLPLPVPVAAGVPGEGFPFAWSVCPWLPGERASAVPVDAERAARDLAAFVAAMRAVDVPGGPAPGGHNFGRGVPLADRDEDVRESITALDGIVDTAAASAAWDECLRAPVWDGPPLWIHGDLHGDNLLATDGRISAVIDFGGLGVGDPAVDVMVAWTFLPAGARETFRAALGVDDATWERARGWVLSMALMALPYYLHTNPGIVRNARRWLAAALDG